MSKNKNLVMIFILIVAGIAGFMASKQFYNTKDNNSYSSLLIYPEDKSFSGFTLTDKNNKPLDNNSFANHWTLLFFGFTNCPDVCPTTLTQLQRAFKILESNNLKQMPQVLFVSVDPDRDTPKSLKEYIAFFNPKFNAATSDKANILSLASQIGVAFNVGKHEKGEINYSVDHTAAVFLVNPQKKLYGIFRSPHEAQKIAADLSLLIGSK